HRRQLMTCLETECVPAEMAAFPKRADATTTDSAAAPAAAFAQRAMPIYVFLPMTCQLLAADLHHELEVFWSLYGELVLEDLPEIVCFARFLRGRLQEGALSNPYLGEVVDYEAAAAEVRFTRGCAGASRVVRFTYDPVRLLDALSQRRA